MREIIVILIILIISEWGGVPELLHFLCYLFIIS